MADLSYLFGGSTPSTITDNVSDMGTNLPAWLQEYTRALAGQATAAAGEQYQPYTSPTNAAQYGEAANRIAGFSPMQQQAQQGVQSMQGTHQPYINYAAQTLPQAQQSYMNPYTNQVVDRIADLGQRNLSENLLPQVNQTFTGAGQFGGTRNAEFTNRALRDANESIMGQQAQALQTGYSQAQTAALADLQRQAQLGQLAQQLGYQDVSMLDTIGQQQQQQTQRNMDLAMQDFMAQRNYPKQQLSFLSDIIRGQPVQQVSSFQSNIMPGAVTQQLSPLAAATQGFLGARSILSPVQTQSTGVTQNQPTGTK